MCFTATFGPDLYKSSFTRWKIIFYYYLLVIFLNSYSEQFAFKVSEWQFRIFDIFCSKKKIHIHLHLD